MKVKLLRNPWVLRIIALEFFERLAYYASVFIFTNYAVDLMGFNTKESNATLQGLWAVSPATAILSSYLGDVTWGRPKTVAVFSVLYAIALVLVAISALPVSPFFSNFPDGVSTTAQVTFLIGVVLLGVGYGGMKSSTSPLIADCALHCVQDDCCALSLEDRNAVLSSLYRWYYWSFNIGGLVGSAAGTFLLDVKMGFRPNHDDKGKETGLGYYATFWMSAGVTVLGLIIFISGGLKGFARSKHSTNLLQILKYSCNRDLRKQETTSDTISSEEKQQKTSESLPLIQQEERATTEATNEGEKLSYDNFPSKIACLKNVAILFSILPFYWLVNSQYSSNIFVQAEWLEMPSAFPPMVFNNVNTFTTVAVLPILDLLVFPYLTSGRKRPSTVNRMYAGFLCSVLGMLWCGVLQLEINKRGSIDDKANYHLYEGQSELNAWLLIPPYVLQGIASAFVDTAAIETGYLMAPLGMKSLVHAMYLMASSISGFIGLIYSPFVTPKTFSFLFFSFGGVLFVISSIFFVVAGRKERSAETPVEDLDQ